MDFVNNYSQAVTLAQGATTLGLTLPDGEYRLTLTDSATDGTRWEVVGAVVASGTATLERAMEGTTDQLWPTGSIIYCDVTAGVLELLQSSGGAPSDTGWLTVPFAPGIEEGPQYRNLGGVVYLRGFVYVDISDMGSPLCTLPVGSRPSSSMFVNFEVNDARRYRINVLSSGDISVVVQFNGVSDYANFDFISFPAG